MGLEKSKIIDYWKDRVSWQGGRATGCVNETDEQNEQTYKERIEWIGSRIRKTANTLDYGCGTGRYAPLFDPDHYTGMDIIRYDEFPNGYTRIILDEPCPKLDGLRFMQIFTATVLQHNSDEHVITLLKEFKKVKPFALAFYESTEQNIGQADHCRNRTVGEYVEMVNMVFPEDYMFERNVHYPHGQEHSLMIWEFR